MNTYKKLLHQYLRDPNDELALELLKSDITVEELKKYNVNFSDITEGIYNKLNSLLLERKLPMDKLLYMTQSNKSLKVTYKYILLFLSNTEFNYTPEKLKIYRALFEHLKWFTLEFGLVNSSSYYALYPEILNEYIKVKTDHLESLILNRNFRDIYLESLPDSSLISYFNPQTHQLLSEYFKHLYCITKNVIEKYNLKVELAEKNTCSCNDSLMYQAQKNYYNSTFGLDIELVNFYRDDEILYTNYFIQI